MKQFILIFTFMALLCSCGHDFDNTDYMDYQVKENLLKVFGVEFQDGHSWCSTSSYKISVVCNPEGFDVSEVKIITCSPFGNGDANGSLSLNCCKANNGDVVELVYDVPVGVDKLYAACINGNGEYYIKSFKVGQDEVVFSSPASTRGISQDELNIVNCLPANPVLGSYIESYAKLRGYKGFENDRLYSMSDIEGQMMMFGDYDDEFKEDLRDVIFTYLPNKASNIEKIREHRYYNENCYPITTGDEPIIVEPFYKNDGGYKEIEKCALYYYYFKDSDLEGLDEVGKIQFIKNLPKFRMIDFGDCVLGRYVSPGMKDDVIKRGIAFVAIYWGEEPYEGCVGAYQFPAGYKIGFMLRNEGKDVHKGELYCDGRLNGEVNKWGHLASAKLGENDARMTWLGCNGKNYLCCESGTDRDFNDIVMEIEGGIEPIGDYPDVEYNRYTYCFEDTRIGDYDLNDVVIKARRLSDTEVEYSVIACGALDDIFIKGINGKNIKDNVEVHKLFGIGNEFVNTVKGGDMFDAIVDTIKVNKDFSFLDKNNTPYIYNASKGYNVKIARAGEDPHGIMIPFNFRYPLERVCIKDAYLKFNEWGQNQLLSTDWYKWPEENKTW